MPFYQEQSNKNNSKMILAHILKRRNGNKTSAQPIENVLIPDKHVALKVFYIELKYN